MAIQLSLREHAGVNKCVHTRQPDERKSPGNRQRCSVAPGTGSSLITAREQVRHSVSLLGDCSCVDRARVSRLGAADADVSVSGSSPRPREAGLLTIIVSHS